VKRATGYTVWMRRKFLPVAGSIMPHESKAWINPTSGAPSGEKVSPVATPQQRNSGASASPEIEHCELTLEVLP